MHVGAAFAIDRHAAYPLSIGVEEGRDRGGALTAAKIVWPSMLAASIERREIAARYESFARCEAAGRSPLYARIAAAIAGDPGIIAFLATLPPAKRQPNLLLGVVRYLYGTPGDPGEFAEVVREHESEIAAVMAARRTQTNEPARCATLLPVLAQLPQPLALLEVGAAAGLCLLPDRYAYDYGSRRIDPTDSCGLDPPVFNCRAGAGTPLPERNVEVAWRAGLDLDPVDLGDQSQVRWLEALVWPGEEYRLPLLRAAIEIARCDPPHVSKGDLRADLPGVAARAPADATLVVFHTAVMAYVADEADRARFAETVSAMRAVWIANEGPQVLPGIPEQIIAERPAADDMLMCVDGQPTAWTDGHGTWIDWRTAPEGHGHP